MRCKFKVERISKSGDTTTVEMSPLHSGSDSSDVNRQDVALSGGALVLSATGDLGMHYEIGREYSVEVIPAFQTHSAPVATSTATLNDAGKTWGEGHTPTPQEAKLREEAMAKQTTKNEPLHREMSDKPTRRGEGGERTERVERSGDIITPQGVIDSETGELRPHGSEFKPPVEPDPHTTKPGKHGR